MATILYRLQLVKSIDNKMTVVQGKLKSMPIICIYVTCITISIMYDCMFLTVSKHYQMIGALFYQVE